jgi:hypothetical protein
MAKAGSRGGARVEPRFNSIGKDGTIRGDGGGRGSLSGGRGKALGICVALLAFAGFAGVAWYAKTQGQKDSSSVVPVIRADRGPVKTRPEKPGGLDVPNQDKLVFTQITPETEKPKVERLLPPPEEPMARPAAAQPKKAAVPVPPSGPLVPDVPKVSSRPGGAPPRPDMTVEAEGTAKKKGGEIAVLPNPKLIDKKPGKGVFHVQFGAVKSRAGAAKEAARITQAHSAILGKLRVAATRAELGNRGVFYRLRAGPIPLRETADMLCRKFAARKIRCIVIKP